MVVTVGTAVVLVVLDVDVELVDVLVAVGTVVVGAVVVEVVVGAVVVEDVVVEDVVVEDVVVEDVVGEVVSTTSACAPAMLFAPLGTLVDTIALPAVSCGAVVNEYD